MSANGTRTTGDSDRIAPRTTVARILPGYAVHCLAHLVCLPYLIANGLARLFTNRYKGVAWRRFFGGTKPPAGRDWVVVVGTALGESTTAVRAARAIRERHGSNVAVWLELAPVYETISERSDEAHVGLAPFNNPFSVLIGLLRWRPKGIIFIESDRNMHLTVIARLLGVSTVLANVKISEGRTNRYARRFMSAWRFKAVGRVGVQSEVHRERLTRFGVPRAITFVSGPAMVDVVDDEIRREKVQKWRQILNLNGHKVPIVVAGSTHKAEEAEVVGAFQIFRRSHPNAVMILAPRYTWRKDGPDSTLRELQTDFEKRSSLNGTMPSSGIVLLDTQGELHEVYSVATAAFVGGSLIKGVGGHSPIEPAAWGAPVTIGPNFAQQEALVSACKDAGLLTVCASGKELASRWSELSENGANGEFLLRANDLLRRHANVFLSWLDALEIPRREALRQSIGEHGTVRHP
jgi:3-deoxy-D-manno-octulosonic-acid transferase